MSKKIDVRDPCDHTPNPDAVRITGKLEGLRTIASPPIFEEIHTGPGITQQEFKDDCDMNLILKKYGVYAGMDAPPAIYRDVSHGYDYLEAFNAVEEANAAFAALPADARRQLGDSPWRLMQLSQTPEGVAQLKKMGFADLSPEPEAPTPAVEPQEPKAPKKS
jgi:hypothetical protein